MVQSERTLVSFYYSSISTRVPEILDCSFEWGLRTPNLGEGDAVGGSGMVPFERALVSFYRSSIHTIPLSAVVRRFCPKF